MYWWEYAAISIRKKRQNTRNQIQSRTETIHLLIIKGARKINFVKLCLRWEDFPDIFTDDCKESYELRKHRCDKRMIADVRTHVDSWNSCSCAM
eukprot:10516008-Karenia_brevis.AAC.1